VLAITAILMGYRYRIRFFKCFGVRKQPKD